MRYTANSTYSLHRRCVSLDEAMLIYDREHWVDPCFDPSFLTLKSEKLSVLKESNHSVGSQNSAKSRVCERDPSGHGRRRSSSCICIEQDDTSEQRDASCSSFTLEKEVVDASYVGTNDTSRPIPSAKPEQNEMHNVALEQARAKELWLQRRLQQIQRIKQRELDSIEARKQQELRNLEAKFSSRPQKRQEETCMEKTTRLIVKVQSARNLNRKLKKELQKLKFENKRLATVNSELLRNAGQEEIKLNQMARCGLELPQVANWYRQATVAGRTMLRDLDNRNAVYLPANGGGRDRLNEIQSMITLAQAEDDLLV